MALRASKAGSADGDDGLQLPRSAAEAGERIVAVAQAESRAGPAHKDVLSGATRQRRVRPPGFRAAQAVVSVVQPLRLRMAGHGAGAAAAQRYKADAPGGEVSGMERDPETAGAEAGLVPGGVAAVLGKAEGPEPTAAHKPQPASATGTSTPEEAAARRHLGALLLSADPRASLVAGLLAEMRRRQKTAAHAADTISEAVEWEGGDRLTTPPAAPPPSAHGTAASLGTLLQGIRSGCDTLANEASAGHSSSGRDDDVELALALFGRLFGNVPPDWQPTAAVSDEGVSSPGSAASSLSAYDGGAIPAFV